MRKNIEKVLAAFVAGRAATGKSCHTDGTTVWSYNMPIAGRDDEGYIWVIPYNEAPSATTRSQVRACEQLFPRHSCTEHEDCRHDRGLAKACWAVKQSRK